MSAALLLRRHPKSLGSQVFEWSLAADNATRNEGQTVDWTLTLNRNGAAMVPCSIQFFGQAVSLPSGTFQEPGASINTMVSNAAAATAGCVVGGSFRTIAFDATFAGTLHLSRTTVNQSASQGAITSISNASPGVVTTPAAHGLTENTVIRLTTSGGLPTGLAINTNYFVHVLTTTTFSLAATASGTPIATSSAGSGTHLLHLRAGLYVANATLGTILTTDTYYTTIVDVPFVASGTLDHATFDVGAKTYVNSPSHLGVAVAVDTLVAEILGFTSLGAAVVPDTVTLNDTLGGAFKIVQTGSGGSARFFLKIGATGPTFESAVAPVPRTDYRPTVTVTKGVDSVSAQLIVYPLVPEINPTGDPTNNVVLVARTFAAWRAEAGKTTPNRTIDFVAGAATVAVAANVGTTLTASRCTYKWPAEICFNTGKEIAVREGDDIRLIKPMIGGGQAYNNQTRAFIFANSGSTPLRNLIVDRGVIFQMNDELTDANSLGNLFAGRGLKYYRCMFVDAANDPARPNHNFGPLAAYNQFNTDFDKCILLGGASRNPQSANAWATTVRNCIIGAWGTSNIDKGGVIASGARTANLVDAYPGSMSIHDNLFISPPNGGVLGRAAAIYLFFVDENQTWVYCADNHFIDPLTDTFTNDPLVIGDGIYLRGCTSNAALKTSYPAFTRATSVYTTLPNTTEAQHRALYADVLGDCGNGSLYALDILAQFPTKAFRPGTPGTYPSVFAGLYGADWTGGGSLTHGVV